MFIFSVPPGQKQLSAYEETPPAHERLPIWQDVLDLSPDYAVAEFAEDVRKYIIILNIHDGDFRRPRRWKFATRSLRSLDTHRQKTLSADGHTSG